MKYINELIKLELPEGKYAIFGSGPLSIRGIRRSEDLDIIVKNDLWEQLEEKYPDYIYKNPACIKIGNIEIYQDWLKLSGKINKMIDTADTIKGFPFVKLKYVIEWKKESKRKKDIADLEMINKYKTK